MEKKLQEFNNELKKYFALQEKYLKNHEEMIASYLEGKDKRSKKENEIFEKYIAESKAKYDRAKKDYEDFYSTIIDIRKEEQVKQILNAKNQEDLDREEVKNQKENFDAIIAIREEHAEKVEALNARAANADKAMVGETKKTFGKTKEEWKTIDQNIKEATAVGMDSLNNMFTGMTKYMDEAIAKRKKEIEGITKQVSQIQKDLAFEQKKADKCLC